MVGVLGLRLQEMGRQKIFESKEWLTHGRKLFLNRQAGSWHTLWLTNPSQAAKSPRYSHGSSSQLAKDDGVRVGEVEFTAKGGTQGVQFGLGQLRLGADVDGQSS